MGPDATHGGISSDLRAIANCSIGLAGARKLRPQNNAATTISRPRERLKFTPARSSEKEMDECVGQISQPVQYIENGKTPPTNGKLGSGSIQQ